MYACRVMIKKRATRERYQHSSYLILIHLIQKAVVPSSKRPSTIGMILPVLNCHLPQFCKTQAHTQITYAPHHFGTF